MDKYVSLDDLDAIKPEFLKIILDHVKENKGFTLFDSCKVIFDLFGDEILIKNKGNVNG